LNEPSCYRGKTNDRRSLYSLKQSITACASRIPEGQVSDTSRAYPTGEDGNINAVVAEVMGWLARSDNNIDWLVVFDNVAKIVSALGR